MNRKASNLRHPGTGRMLSVLVVALLLTPAAQAFGRHKATHRPDGSGSPAQALVEPPRLLAGKSTDRIIGEIERKHRAKVIQVKESEAGGRKVLVLRLLSEEGRVWTVRVDAETGKEI